MQCGGKIFLASQLCLHGRNAHVNQLTRINHDFSADLEQEARVGQDAVPKERNGAAEPAGEEHTLWVRDRVCESWTLVGMLCVHEFLLTTANGLPIAIRIRHAVNTQLIVLLIIHVHVVSCEHMWGGWHMNMSIWRVHPSASNYGLAAEENNSQGTLPSATSSPVSLHVSSSPTFMHMHINTHTHTHLCRQERGDCALA